MDPRLQPRFVAPVGPPSRPTVYPPPTPQKKPHRIGPIGIIAILLLSVIAFVAVTGLRVYPETTCRWTAESLVEFCGGPLDDGPTELVIVWGN